MIKRTIITVLLSASIWTAISAQTGKTDLPLKSTITDPNAQTPPDLERNYDELLTTWKNTMRIPDSENNIYASESNLPDSVYINRLHSLPTQMELVYNPLVRIYIDMYAGRRRNQVSYMLGLGQHYFPLFEAALDKEEIPLELKYLPVIESALNPIARSRVGATGLWQFMAPTGRMYDLEINSLVDERRDPVKSTEAAVKYLKDLYAIYGDWNLVIAAYNCGPGNVNKAIRRSGGLTDYWAIYPYLPRETRGYVPIFIAATYIMSYHKEHNIPIATCDIPASIDSIKVDKQVHFKQISEVLDIPIDDIRRYNPQYKKDIVPGTYKPYAINLPMNKITAFIDKENDILAYNNKTLLNHRKVAGVDVVNGGTSSVKGGKVHKVKRGDTLGKIASRYGITVSQVKSWNKLKSNKLKVGRYLTVGLPPSKEEETPDEIVSTNTESGTTITKGYKTVEKIQTSYYKIKRGDNWTAISKKQGVSIANLKKWNNIKNNQLIAGKTLKIQKVVYEQVPNIITIPEPEIASIELDSTHTVGVLDEYIKKVIDERDEETSPTMEIASATDADTEARNTIDDSRIIYHKVKIGETMTQIAARYKVDKKDIIEWNKLSSNTAKVGNRLLIHLPIENQ